MIKKIFNILRIILFSIAVPFCFVAPANAADFTLSWYANIEPDLAGYKIYDDTAPGPSYHGTGADQGPSPITMPIGGPDFDENNPECLLSGLDDGKAYFLVLTAYDVDGHESDYSSELKTPLIAITSPPDGFYVNADNCEYYAVSGQADDSAVVDIFVGDTLLGTTTVLDGTWTINVDFASFNEGEVSLIAKSGGVTSRNVTGTYDKTLPASPVITTDGGNGPGNDFTTNYSTVTLQGDYSEDTEALFINGDTGGFSFIPNEHSWNYTATLQPGENTFIFTVIDAAGNISDAGSITVTFGVPVGGYSNDYVIPAGQVSQSTNGDGIITIPIKIKDTSSDPCTLHTFQYSVDGGMNWITPVGGDGSGALCSGWQDNYGSHYSSAADFDSAEAHSFTFNTKHEDIIGLDGIEQSDVRVRFSVNDGTFDNLSSVTSENFSVDNVGPIVDIIYDTGNSQPMGEGPLAITAIFNEPLGTIPRITIDRPNPMSTIGPVDMSGLGSVWTFDIDIEQNNGTTVFDNIYVVAILNAKDLAGNALPESSGRIFTVDTNDTDNDGTDNYDDTDDDNDNLPDNWEEAYGSDHLDSDGINGKDGDLDDDGWTNYEEYLRGTDPSDNTSFPASSTPEIVEVIPHLDAGIIDDTRIPNDTSFCVRIEAPDGININYPGSIVFTVDDGVTDNEIDLDDAKDVRVRVTKLDQNEDDTEVTQLWAVYHICEDDVRGNSFPFGRMISIWVYAVDINNHYIDRYFQFEIETEIEHDEAAARLQEMDVRAVSAFDLEDPEHSYDAGIKVMDGDLQGAKIVYNSSDPVTPTFGPLDEIPALDIGSVGVPLNLQPPTVFATPVKIFIPCPGRTDVADLGVYLYNGTDWAFACDAEGNVQPGGDGWVVPDSRVNHVNTVPPTIEIKVYHFTGVQAGLDTTYFGGGGGGGCFISTADWKSPDRGLKGGER